MAGPGRRVPRGMKPAIENPGAVLKRLLSYVFRFYKAHMILVFICIILSVVMNLQGTMFMQVLIDDYIEPMLTSGSRDFGPLVGAILRTAGFYAVGNAAGGMYAVDYPLLLNGNSYGRALAYAMQIADTLSEA